MTKLQYRFALVLAAGLLAAPALAAPAAAPAGNAENGKALYMDNVCWSCHGTTGSGGNGAGPKLAPNPLPLGAIINQLRHPNRMPPYTEKLLSDAQIADIRAYLATEPAGKTAAQIPILNR